MAHLIQLYTTKSTPEHVIIASPVQHQLSNQPVLWDHVHTPADESLSLALGYAQKTQDRPFCYTWQNIKTIEYVLCPSHLHQGQSEKVTNTSARYLQTLVECLDIPGDDPEYLWSMLIRYDLPLTIALVQNDPDAPTKRLKIMPLYQPGEGVFDAYYQWYTAFPAQ